MKDVKLSSVRTVGDILSAITNMGWRIEVGKSHYKAFHPNGKSIVTISKTPSDHRAIKNIISDIRRAG